MQLKSIRGQCLESNRHLAAMSECSRRECNRAPEVLRILSRIAENTHGIADNTHALCNFAEQAQEMAEARKQWGSGGGGGGGNEWKSG